MYKVEQEKLRKVINGYRDRTEAEKMIVKRIDNLIDDPSTDTERFMYCLEGANPWTWMAGDMGCKAPTKKATERLNDLKGVLYMTAWEMAHLEDMPPAARDEHLSNSAYRYRWGGGEFLEFCERRREERRG